MPLQRLQRGKDFRLHNGVNRKLVFLGAINETLILQDGFGGAFLFGRVFQRHGSLS
jgi:hypothetical protein